MSGRRALGLAGLAMVTLIFVVDSVAAGAATAPATATVPAAPQPRARSAAGLSRLERTDLVLEGGAALPLGDLRDRYLNTVKGFGQHVGYDVGVRLRVVWRSGWALSPSFHYQGYGRFTSTKPSVTVGTPGDPYAVSTSLLSYGLDAQHFWPAGAGGLQPYVTGGLAVCRNRYRDELLTTAATHADAAVNALALVLGAGLRVHSFEVTLSYALNRFASARLLVPSARTDYNWDGLTLRIGLALPSVDSEQPAPPADTAAPPPATPPPPPPEDS